MWSLIILFSYSISLCMNGGSNAPVILALQQGEYVIPVDTAGPDYRGCARFEGDLSLEAGQYVFVQHNRRLFNFLISCPEAINLSFSANLQDGRTLEVQAEGSEENNAYMRFNRFLQEHYARASEILEEGHDPEKSLAEVERLEATIREYAAFLAREYEGYMLGIIAKNIFTPAAGPGEAAMHYLGNIDFTDPRILNTSILPLRLKEYFTGILPPLPDSLIFHADRILKQDIHPKVKGYVARYLFTLFFTSEIMGMENAAFHMADSWLLADSLLCPDPELAREMETFVRFNKQCLLGMRAPELNLPDVHGTMQSLHQTEARYTILFFFEDNCPACSREILKLTRFARDYNDPDVKFFAVYTQDDKDILTRYAAYFPSNWTTLWDPDFSSGFDEKFNVRSTPRIYLLDKNKTIIGRDLDTETLERLIRDHSSKQEVVLPKAPDLMLETDNGTSCTLYGIQAPYTILYFYDPACSVCGLVTARLYELFLSARDKGLVFFAVYTGNDYPSWKKWLIEGGYSDWINVWNPAADDRIHKVYNISDPPLILLLDREKGIVADNLSPGALSIIINQLNQ
ncbi:MAG: TlpA disulfide reductase family protein [Bacteroidales bacterium]|nr:TlpA disulfide reductase family protein [Bacteroidales bacterium]MDD3521988.1 TlpA disulfide reductase family protein [Bacteroidales bacterium]MDD4030524.1 TlpA disulfide reductase family protein [Bacteroidales bacterium]MDD4434861.1 TlpA disulfide reductase family protein [Bacteroidales bacterium]MDD5732484.1 TlpA disulfide reductase family protein [Bacteroidales bacterium]